MIIKLPSSLTGNLNEMDLPITPDQLRSWQESGGHVQDCFPQLAAEEREFLISGVTPTEWANMPNEPEWDNDPTASD